MYKDYDCERGCPLYHICCLVHMDVYGAPLAGRIGIDHYSQCPHYRACAEYRDPRKLKECLMSEVLREESEEGWDEDDSDEDPWNDCSFEPVEDEDDFEDWDIL